MSRLTLDKLIKRENPHSPPEAENGHSRASFVHIEMFRIRKDPELPAWVFLALRIGSLLAVAIIAAIIVRCNGY
jgi:hypothetical protein